MFILRDYQQRASDKAVGFFTSKEGGGNGLLLLPTGAGKSLIIADIARRLSSDVLVLQPSKEILEQNFKKYTSYGLQNCSIYSASFNRKDLSAVTFATIGSIMADVGAFDHFASVIIDECHKVNATEGQYKTFINRVPRKVLGLTATPYRLQSVQGIVTEAEEFLPNGAYCKDKYFIDGYLPKAGVEISQRCILKFLTRTRPRIFTSVLYQQSVADLVRRGYLSRINYYDLTPMDTTRVRRNSTGRDWDDSSLAAEYSRVGYEAGLAGVVSRLLTPKRGGQRKGILVFTKFVKESEYLKSKVAGVEIVTASTSKTDRERILRDFKDGRVRVLANVGVLTTGFDYPELDTVVVARPTMSLAMWYQMVGRVIRPFENKAAWVVDIGGNIRRFGKVEDLYLTEHNCGEYVIRGIVGGEDKQLTNCYF